MKKSAQVVMLPTNEKAPTHDYLFLYKPSNRLVKNGFVQHLYFLSDEEIKEGDWVYCLREGFEPVLKQKVNPIGVNNDKMFKKIIATTDRSLEVVSKGINPVYEKLPQPSTSFIEKFVEEYNKGNVITEVMVEYEYNSYSTKTNGELTADLKLKINPDNTIDINMPKDSWSREEVVELIQKYSKECTGWPWFETDEKWIEENL